MLWKDIKWYLYTVIQYDNNCIHYNDFNCKAATNTDFYPVPFKWIFIIITGQIIKSLKLWSLLHLPSLSFPSALDQILHLAAFKSHLKTFFYYELFCFHLCILLTIVCVTVTLLRVSIWKLKRHLPIYLFSYWFLFILLSPVKTLFHPAPLYSDYGRVSLLALLDKQI